MQGTPDIITSRVLLWKDNLVHLSLNRGVEAKLEDEYGEKSLHKVARNECESQEDCVRVAHGVSSPIQTMSIKSCNGCWVDLSAQGVNTTG